MLYSKLKWTERRKKLMTYDYDVKDPERIEAYAKRLIGKTFRDVYDEDMQSDQDGFHDHDLDKYRVQVSKGDMGNLLEEHYFHYANNSDQRPDFDEAGTELKTTPFKKLKNGSLSAKERVPITMIDYNKVVYETFDTSEVKCKTDILLLVYYLQLEKMKRIDCPIKYVSLFCIPEADKLQIINDYNAIVDKIRAGKAHELSEGDTLYLGACTKGRDSSDVRSQPFSDIPAMRRAFCFKQSYMTNILRNYIAPGIKTYKKPANMVSDDAEKIIKDIDIYRHSTLEQYVISKINLNRGRDIISLCKEYGLSPTCSKSDKGESGKASQTRFTSKQITASIAYRILGIKGNQAEEFVKAGIQVKTIRLTKDGKIKESMSFPTFKFQEIANGSWEDDEFAETLRTTKFFFVVYRFDDNDVLRLKGCQFWNMPTSTIETDVRKVWQKTHDVLNDGLEITVKNGKRFNNLPGMSFNPVCHVRPHGQNSKDVDTLPDGRTYTKQCFWLTNTYILSQLDEKLKA